MKIDQQYLKNLLIAFEDNPATETNIHELKVLGFDYHEPKFLFHMRLLDDQRLIARVDDRPGFGYYNSSDRPGFATVPLRLTSEGHAFIEALRQKEVWNSVKENFKDASVSTLVDVAKQLAQGYAKQKIKSLTGFDPD